MRVPGIFSGRARRLDQPAPKKGIARYFYIIFTHFWKFLALDLLFIVFSLPIITIPAAICAHNRVCFLLTREGNCFLWSDFRDEFKSSIWRAVPIGLMYGIGIALGYYLLSIGAANDRSIFGVLFFAMGLTAVVYSLVAGSWTFALMAIQPLNNRTILRNARAMTALEMPRGVLMVLVYGAVLALTLLLSPYSLVVLPFSLSFIQFTVCSIMNPAIEKRVLLGASDETDNEDS